MAITTAAGTKYYIGTSAAIDYTTDESAIEDFEAEEWIEIGKVEDGGEFGDARNDITALSLSDGRVNHLPGAADAGVMPLTCLNDPLDPGQIAVLDASRTNFEYNFKIEENDAPSELYANTITYVRGRVLSRRKQIGNADNVVRRLFSVGVTTEPLEIPAALLSP